MYHFKLKKSLLLTQKSPNIVNSCPVLKTTRNTDRLIYWGTGMALACSFISFQPHSPYTYRVRKSMIYSFCLQCHSSQILWTTSNSNNCIISNCFLYRIPKMSNIYMSYISDFHTKPLWGFWESVLTYQTVRITL